MCAVVDRKYKGLCVHVNPPLEFRRQNARRSLAKISTHNPLLKLQALVYNSVQFKNFNHPTRDSFVVVMAGSYKIHKVKLRHLSFNHCRV